MYQIIHTKTLPYLDYANNQYYMYTNKSNFIYRIYTILLSDKMNKSNPCTFDMEISEKTKLLGNVMFHFLTKNIHLLTSPDFLESIYF